MIPLLKHCIGYVHDTVNFIFIVMVELLCTLSKRESQNKFEKAPRGI